MGRFACCRVDQVYLSHCELDRSAAVRYSMIEEALNASGRHMLLSASGNSQVTRAPWIGAVTNSWATASPESSVVTWEEIMKRADRNNLLYRFAGPGHFNDAGPLQVD